MDFLYQIVKFDTQHDILSRIFKPKNAKKYEKMAKNGQKMAKIKNPFKLLLLTHFALYMPKIMGFGQKTKKRYHNCPTQQYMTGPLFNIYFFNISPILLVF